MDQYQQYPTTNPGTPYDFILNPQQQPPQRRFKLGKENLAMTIAVLVGGTLLFMIIVTLLLNIFTSGGSNKDDLISLAQTQNELIRVSSNAVPAATQQTTKNLAVTVQFTLTTQQQQILDILANSGTKLKKKQLALKQNGETDQKLANAKATSTFDSTFAQLMQEELESYANTIKQFGNKTTSQTQRDLATDYYQQTQLIISQIPYAQAAASP